MKTGQPHRIKTISDYHKLAALPKLEHPMISVINFELIKDIPEENLIFDFYSIALKWNFSGRIKYGHQEYDFDSGMMTFMSPVQRFRIEGSKNETITHSGWLLLIHPDFFLHSSLAKTIHQYEFFDYSVNEALFLSEREEQIVTDIMENIQKEYHANIDNFSQTIIIAQLELLFSYADRFYNRQFITRKITNKRLLNRLENLLAEYFEGDNILKNGLPTVGLIAERLNVSSGYLGTLLKVLTGLNAQQHIHGKLIEKAKEKLSTTDFSISEIAYQLGFGHVQSFSKLFKSKTDYSPLEFRKLFN